MEYIVYVQHNSEGMEIMYSEKGIILHQLKYKLELLNYKVSITPADINQKLDFDFDSDGDNVDATMFKQLVGSLRYLCNTKPYICYAVGIVSRFMSKPKWSHYQVAVRILRVDRRRTSGYLFKFIGSSISWCSKKQPVVGLLTCEAEYIAGVVTACLAVWLLNLLQDLQIKCFNSAHVHHIHVIPTIPISDSALKFTHVFYNLSPTGTK
ncbi:uncharacterized mitochondrial protein AtMg00810-like [Lathyrus oleraceus]|uniref:uncharacterized mitochondrial protein AtMg00810-like n=1 Tax=Pisum sativum TaxID=3888 RepID=UPI0021D3B9B6|nr:uncharacterized mitochondrial protein AtMg00810-like [Pisum sativum]